MVADNTNQADDTAVFLRAARSGDFAKVVEFLDTGFDINAANSNGLNALHLASKDGHARVVTELLKRGAKVDATTKKGNTALHIASLAGQLEVVNILIQNRAAVNIQSQNGFTPLYMAAQENHDEVVKLLLNNGANQSLATEDGFTPLVVAMQQGHNKVVSVLLENDSKGKVRLPALHIAARKDDCKTAEFLLQNDRSKPDVTSKSGFTPLHIAAHYGNANIARLLIKRGADVNYLAKHSISPLHVAAKWGKNNMVKLLLENSAQIDAKTRDGLTPLHCAARSGHEQVITTLLENSAPISARTKSGLAPLHMASQGDHVDAARILLYHRAPVDDVTTDYLTSLHVAAHCGHVRVAKLLLERKADSNARALNGFTPLHIACKKNRIKVVELLLKHGASIESTTESGLTPLHVASFMGCMSIVIFLLQHEANPDVPTIRGETPLHLAARANQTDIIRILLRNGAKVDARAREEQTPLHIASRLGNIDIVMLLLQHGAAVDTTTKDMYTALHIAAKGGQEEVAALLVENNASVKATTKNGYTPLHIAAKYGNMNVAEILLQKDSKLDAQGKNDISPLHLACHYDHLNVVNLLLEKGASPHLASQNGHTPLHTAARKNQMDIASALLEHGANANAESKAGFTPLHLSAEKGHSDMVNLLIEHGADPNHKAKNGLTALHLCAQEDFVKVASILVKNGADIESQTITGYRPIHVAGHFGNLTMIRFLLKQKANIDVRTGQNYTPLHQAAQQGHAHIVSILLEKNASYKARTNDGLTALNIAQKLGYISVIEVLKGLSYDSQMPDNKNWEERYKVVAPESLQETSLMSDSDDEGDSDALISEQPYRYLTADLMKSLRDDSLPIDVTRDDPIHRQDEKQEFAQSNNYCLAETFDSTDGLNLGFLVDARGGAMKSCRHSGVRIIVPPRRAPMPIRVTCRLVKPSKVANPPSLMEGEALATRIIEMGPIGATFLGPVLIDIPHFASIREKEREIIILRSKNGETWKEHDNFRENDDNLLNTPHDPQMNAMHSGRITRILTTEFPQYFAIVTRIKQEVHVIGAEGGILTSSVDSHVQALFPPGALTKKIKVGLQAHVIPAELTAKLLGNCVAVSPVITIEPRRRKFHMPITVTIPVPQAANKGMINQYGGESPTLRLLCSIAGGTSESQWEDVTGSTPLTLMEDKVSFTTTVSARFWLMDCRNISAVPKMATELYVESLFVPYITNFVIYSKRMDIHEATLRILCMTDSREGMHTLERQEEFVEIVKSRDVEALDGKDLYIEFSGNLVPVTKSGVQLKFTFKAFRQNRLSFHVKVKDPLVDPVARMLFMREPKVAKGEPPQQPICVLNIVLPKFEIRQKAKAYEDSNIIDQKLDSLESKYKLEQKEKGDEPKETSPSERKFITDSLEREQTDAAIHESLAQKAASPLESVDASYPNKVAADQQEELSPTVEKQTYSEKRKFWEDISRKRESYQRSESEISRTSQLTINESDSENPANVISAEGEPTTEAISEVGRSETMEDLNVPDISECSVAEKAHYFEEQIQKELAKVPRQDSVKSEKEKEKVVKKTVEEERTETKVEVIEKYVTEAREDETKPEERKEVKETAREEKEKDEKEYGKEEVISQPVMEVCKKLLNKEREEALAEEVYVKPEKKEAVETEEILEEMIIKKREPEKADEVRRIEKEDRVEKVETIETTREVAKEKEDEPEKPRIVQEIIVIHEKVPVVKVEKEIIKETVKVEREIMKEDMPREEVMPTEIIIETVTERKGVEKEKESEKGIKTVIEEEIIVETKKPVESTVVEEIESELETKAAATKEKEMSEPEEILEKEDKPEKVKEHIEEIRTERRVGSPVIVEEIYVKGGKPTRVETTKIIEEIVKEKRDLPEKRTVEEDRIQRRPESPKEKTGRRIITEETTIIYKVQKDGTLVQEQIVKSVQIEGGHGQTVTQMPEVSVETKIYEKGLPPEIGYERQSIEAAPVDVKKEIQQFLEGERRIDEDEGERKIDGKPEKPSTVQERATELLQKVEEIARKTEEKELEEEEEEKREIKAEVKQVKKESRIPIPSKVEKDKAPKEIKTRVSPAEGKPMEKPEEKVTTPTDVTSPTKKEFESRIPKRVVETAKQPDKEATKKDTYVKKESETYTVTEKKSSEETSKQYEERSTKSERQTFSKAFTDPQEAFKIFEDLGAAAKGKDFATVTSKVDHKASSKVEKKEVVSSEISSGADKIITHEEKERVERKKSSESKLTKESPGESLEEKKSKSEELDKTAVQKLSMNLTEGKEVIDASASESRAESKKEASYKMFEDKEGITTEESGKKQKKESDVDVAIRIEKDTKDRKKVEITEESPKISKPEEDLGKVEMITQGESHRKIEESFDVKQFIPSEKPEETPEKSPTEKEEAETLEKRQEKQMEKIEARTIAENLIQSIESEIERRSSRTGLKPELLSREYLEKLVSEESEMDHEKLADDLTRKFESIMKKSTDDVPRIEPTKLKSSLHEELQEKGSTKDSMSISEDITKDEESSSRESFPLSSSYARLLDRDITMSPSSISDQIEMEETIDVDTNVLEDVSKHTSSVHSEKQSEKRSDRSSAQVEPIQKDISFHKDKMVSEASGARVLEILEPSAESQSRQDSVDVPSLEMDEHKFSEPTSKDIPSLHESAAADSLERLYHERDITLSPSTVSEDTNVDDSLIHEHVAPSREFEERGRKRADSFEIESPPMVSPRTKAKGLEIKPVDWMIGDEKIEISETLQPSQVFNQELEEYESSIQQQKRKPSQDESTDIEQESVTKSTEDVSVIESVKESVDSQVVTKSTKFTVVPVSERELEKELVEKKLDISCQELVDILQKEHDAKIVVEGEGIKRVSREESQSDVSSSEKAVKEEKKEEEKEEEIEEKKEEIKVEKKEEIKVEKKEDVKVEEKEEKKDEIKEEKKGEMKVEKKEEVKVEKKEEKKDEIKGEKKEEIKVEKKEEIKVEKKEEKKDEIKELKKEEIKEEKKEEIKMEKKEEIKVEKKEDVKVEKKEEKKDEIKEEKKDKIEAEKTEEFTSIISKEEPAEEIKIASLKIAESMAPPEKQEKESKPEVPQKVPEELSISEKKSEPPKEEPKKPKKPSESSKEPESEASKTMRVDDVLKEWTEAYLTKIKPPSEEYKRHAEKSIEKHDRPGKSAVPSDTCAFKLKKEEIPVDLSARYAITVLDQVVKKEIAEVKESLEAARQDLIEELSENSENVIQIKDSPSEFQFKLQSESIPNDLPFLYKPTPPEHLAEHPAELPPEHPQILDEKKEEERKDETKEEEETDKEEPSIETTEEKTALDEQLLETKSVETEKLETTVAVLEDTEEDEGRPSPLPVSSSDADCKDDSSSLLPPHPVTKRRQKPARSSRKVTSESEADLGSSSGESSNYQSCDYEIGSGSRPSSSDVEALQSGGMPSASEYESALMSIDQTASRPTSQEYQTAASTLSSRESMKSLCSLNSGHLGSIDSTSELSETLVPSETEVDKEESREIEENLEYALEEEREASESSGGSDIPVDEPLDKIDKIDKIDSHIPCRMKRSSEMIFQQVVDDEATLEAEQPTEEPVQDTKAIDSSTSAFVVTPGVVKSVDIMTSRVTEDGIQSVCTQVISTATTEADVEESKETEKIEAQIEPDSLEPRLSLTTDESLETLQSTMQQQASMSTSSTSGMSVETVVEREKSDRHSPDSDSFELIDKPDNPDIIDDFIVIEEVAKEVEEYDAEGKSIRISSIPQATSKNYDRDLENLITETKEDSQVFASQASRNNELFDFESGESPPQASNDDQYSQSYSDEEQYDSGKKWIEMQFQTERVYDIEYDRGPLEDIKEEEITDFEAGSSRFGSLGSHKESVGSIGSVRGSFGSTPDYDVLAGKKYFTRPSDHDNVSLSSLQEFEHLESTVAAENSKKVQCGSQDSINNGSLPRRYMTSRSGHGDDISLSSLKDFEGLERACREAHLIELRAREEEDLLEHESPENRYKLESLARTKPETSAAGSFNPSTSGSDDYEKRIKEIDEIIRIAQSNVEKFDRQDDTTEDISQIEITDAEKTGTQGAQAAAMETEEVPPQKEINVMETSTDSLEMEDNEDKKHHPLCRSSDSLEMKTTLDFPSLSSDSLNNVRDSKETQQDVAEQFSNARRISSDSLDMPIVEQQDTEGQEKDESNGNRPENDAVDNSVGQTSSTETNIRNGKTKPSPSSGT